MPRIWSIATPKALPVPARAAVGRFGTETADLVDADGIDLFDRLHHLGHDVGHSIELAFFKPHADDGVAERIFGRIERGPPGGFRFHAGLLGVGLRRGDGRLGLGLCNQRVDLALDPRVFELDVLLLVQARDFALAFGDRPFLLRLHVFGGEDDLSLGFLFLGFFRRFLGTPSGELNVVADPGFFQRQNRLHFRLSECLVAGDLRLLGLALLVDAGGFRQQAGFRARSGRASASASSFEKCSRWAISASCSVLCVSNWR